MNENININLVEILKDCPVGTKLYTPLIGDCVLLDVIESESANYVIGVGHSTEADAPGRWFTRDGKYIECEGAECLLFPSKENRDWSTFKAPEKEYDFKPFDKVIVRDDKVHTWCADFYSHRAENTRHVTVGGSWKYCIPYEGNEYLIGTHICK